MQPCINYYTLNSQTIKYCYPLPLVPAALEQLLYQAGPAYNLIWICEGDEWKTTFVTSSGHYEYQVMPYSLANSPSVFQGFMNEVLREFLLRFIIVYIDDILIYSWNLGKHHHHVTQVLQKLRLNHLYLKLEKCEFHRDTTHFLGYVISEHCIQMD